MARWLRVITIVSTILAFVGAAKALLSVWNWKARDPLCGWRGCSYNGLYVPPTPPRTSTIGLIVGPRLPFGVYWLLFVGTLLLFAAFVFASRIHLRRMLVFSVGAIAVLALLVADARLPLIYWWYIPDSETSGTAAQHWMHAEWLFLWCLVPCCVAVLAQFFFLRLRARLRNGVADAATASGSGHDGTGSPSPVGEEAGG